MVDLAFLLVTFFILTISFAKAKTMQLVIPDKVNPNEKVTPVKESEALTLILGENNRIFYYKGMSEPKVEVTNYSEKGIRKVLVQFNDAVKNMQRAQGHKVMGPVVMIKPMEKSKYENLVNMLDEMKISGIERYALVDVTNDEVKMVNTAVSNSGVNNK